MLVRVLIGLRDLSSLADRTYNEVRYWKGDIS
jgi:hypothetical protein